MVSTLAIGALILTAIIGTVLIWRVNEPAVRGTVAFVDRIRYAIGIVFLALAAYHLLQSGNILYIAIAVAGFAFLTGYALVERPWADVI